MKALDKQLFRYVARSMFVLVLILLACKYTRGVAVGGILAVAIWASFSGRLGISLCCYALFPLLVVMNPFFVTVGGVGGLFLRFGFITITILLAISAGKRSGNTSPPLGLLWFYLFVSLFSSAGGYAPLISYLKIVNFALLLLGLWLGLRNIDKRPNDLMLFRGFLLTLSTFIIIGSLATLPFPGIAYYVQSSQLVSELGDIAAAGAAVKNSDGMALLCGVTNQSQCLAPLAVVCASWVACDMLFVEHRVSLLHAIILVCSAPLLYMTRSRSALLAACVGGAMIYIYALRHLRVGARLKKSIQSMFMGMLAMVVLAAIIVEVKDNSLSRWIRKTDDVVGDKRGLTEAVTESRSGLIEECMADYRRNPLLGSGFQVAYDFQYLPQDKIIFSAPIEKGVLPLMILGEAGIVGVVVFGLFLIAFYATCSRRKYTITATMFTIMLATNMAEATFFSSGGAGGIIWVVTVVGGFTIDMIVLNQRRFEQSMMMGGRY